MEIPKIEEIKKNLDWILEFFIVGYLALFSLFGKYFIEYDILTRIILSVVVSYLIFNFYFIFSFLSYSILNGRTISKIHKELDLKREEIAVEIIDVYSDPLAPYFNILIFSLIKLLFIINIIQYDISTLIAILFILIPLEIVIGLADGYNIFKKNLNNIKIKMKIKP